jgi:hypothetical protein
VWLLASRSKNERIELYNQGVYWYWAQGNSPHKFMKNTTLRVQKVAARGGSAHSIKGFWVGWWEGAGLSAVFSRLDIDSCI